MIWRRQLRTLHHPAGAELRAEGKVRNHLLWKFPGAFHGESRAAGTGPAGQSRVGDARVGGGMRVLRTEQTRFLRRGDSLMSDNLHSRVSGLRVVVCLQ